MIQHDMSLCILCTRCVRACEDIQQVGVLDVGLRGEHTQIVVGGDGDPSRPRHVVATASYEARAFGVRSGMPLQTAARRCPEAVFLPSDHPAYDAASAQVMAALHSLGVPVEVWGWDEA